MKNSEIVDLFQAISKVGNLTGAKFSYAVSRNFNILKPIYDNYEKNKVTLAESFAKKDDNKKPITEKTKDQFGRQVESYVFEDEKSFQEELKKLQNEDVKVELFKIDLANIPEQITAGQLSGIYILINEDKKAN